MFLCVWGFMLPVGFFAKQRWEVEFGPLWHDRRWALGARCRTRDGFVISHAQEVGPTTNACHLRPVGETNEAGKGVFHTVIPLQRFPLPA